MKCDELKVFNSERINYAVEQVERVDGDIDELHLDDNLFYLKSEADKVIAGLKEHVKSLILDNYLKDKEIRSHKYKRCLAMAREWRNYAAFCGMQSSCHNHRGFGKTAERYNWKECHAWKCVKSWLELAEKFKTNSTVQ